jgi:alpha-L-fucosidase
MSEEGRVYFTTKGQTLYAISLAWPTNNVLVIPALGEGKGQEGQIKKVELLGHDGSLEFTQTADGLTVKFPAEKPCAYAYALKISGLKLPVAAASTPVNPATLPLDATGIIQQ